MNALVKKEIRMLLPAFAGALALVTVPVLLLPSTASQGFFLPFLYLFATIMLGVSSFGREIGLKTIPLMLAQPLERSRVWRTKTLVLGAGTVLIYCAWCLSAVFRDATLILGIDSPGGLGFFALITVALTMGGVWMTLLLRQVAAAFWLTYLVPAVLGVAIKALGGADWLALLVLGLYAAAAFFLARRRFLDFEDAAWTGGAVTLGFGWAARAQSLFRERGAWRAMFWKELKLQEFTLAGMAALFVLHLGVVALRKAGGQSLAGMTRLALESFSLVWLIVPLVAGSLSVAEERQLGTLDEALNLPVTRRAQFTVKLVLVLLLGGLLSAALMRLAEGFGDLIGAGAGSVVGNAFEFSHALIGLLAISLLSFYASTLTRSMVQAMAAGIAVTVFFVIIFSLAASEAAIEIFGWRLWPAIAIPALALAIIWLAYGNYKWLFETGRRWRLNTLGLAAVIVLVSSSAAAIYQRFWGLSEWFVPLESAHGAARLPPGKPVTFRGHWGSALAAILPDGRLWMDRVVYGVRPTVSGGYFAPGSNWVDVALLAAESIAIRADGSLWVSEKLGWQDRLVQFGAETNWQKVVGWSDASAFLLKREGTLWIWGPDAFSPNGLIRNRAGDFWTVGNNVYKGVYPGLRAAFKPIQLGSDSDWERMIKGVGFIYAWKRDGTAWMWRHPQPSNGWESVRLPALDRLQFKCFNSMGPEVWIRDDGSLWWHRLGVDHELTRTGWKTVRMPELIQIGRDTDWMAITAGRQLLALKTDGSIWRWDFDRQSLYRPPERLGTHNDWVGVDYWMDESVALSADGTIWAWPRQDRNARDSDEWLAPSRRPFKIENIFDAK